MANGKKIKPKEYALPSGGWGSMRGIASIFSREHPTRGVVQTLMRQNKPEGYMCTSCSWGRPKHPHKFEFCENGAKSTIWDLTEDRCKPDFFAQHTVTELLQWQDYDLEIQGRLTEPMHYDPSTDNYIPCSWEDAFTGIAAELNELDPKTVIFYTSGKAALEAAYLYGLFARFYGNNNLPDSSNMCHETTSVSLKKVIGTDVGSCVMEDFDHCDAIFYFGQNPGTNSGRFLHPLQEAVKRGCKIIVFNPVKEKGLIEFLNPQDPLEMLTGRGTDLAHMYLQVKPGGDISAIMGLCKHVISVDDTLRKEALDSILDVKFLEQHCHDFNEFAQQARETSWSDIEMYSGLLRADLEAAAEVYIAAERVIGVYGMGLTQHVHGSQGVGMLINLLLLRGNIGRLGAGISPVRGHSNVQGQRTVGISEKPDLVPLDRLAELFDFEPPRDHGLTTVDVCHGILQNEVHGFISLGGNFVRAIPERNTMEQAWTNQSITVYIATKLNRSHLIHGRNSWLLPCLVRAEEDCQENVPQAVTIEDSFSHIHGSIGKVKPASPHLLSELAIITGIAKATLPDHPKWCWDAWTSDYGKVRELIELTYPDDFKDYNQRIFQAGGFYRGNTAHERVWKTSSKKAEFTCPSVLSALGVGVAPGRYHLITMRSNDQFNTTIYGFSDRLRGLEGSREILLISPEDMEQEGLNEGDVVSLLSDAGDDVIREVGGLKITPFNLPRGALGGYYPEMNPLVPLWYHDEMSKTPASKGVPVRIRR
ncbi:Protein YdeP [Acidithiobacillus ferrivorans]|uniref:protein YdeP n=1 Tax=Acidithiobacillus ferrivorans TaxID=160808 RepID=A0A060UUJ8_9PROT|nr:FdhF/YdeP family oxidoreductase [Acidithiobacillus ferrivorans]CDQ12307.1 Protein ydeP [Acidithiobacillus ferrivorans]SMH65149.1 Protein YdeP [Acidithiobacillus ferrivorans]